MRYQSTREEAAHTEEEPPEKQWFVPGLALTQLVFLKSTVEKPLNIGWGPQNDAFVMGLS